MSEQFVVPEPLKEITKPFQATCIICTSFSNDPDGLHLFQKRMKEEANEYNLKFNNISFCFSPFIGVNFVGEGTEEDFKLFSESYRFKIDKFVTC
jgi:hypothetical protein